MFGFAAAPLGAAAVRDISVVDCTGGATPYGDDDDEAAVLGRDTKKRRAAAGTSK